jgi:hypothetical protein
MLLQEAESDPSRLFHRKGMMTTRSRSPSLRKSIIRYWLLLLLSLLISTELQAAVVAAEAEAEGECDSTDKLRLVTREELAAYVPSTILIKMYACEVCRLTHVFFNFQKNGRERF